VNNHRKNCATTVVFSLNLVPKYLNEDAAGSMGPKRSTVRWNRLDLGDVDRIEPDRRVKL